MMSYKTKNNTISRQFRQRFTRRFYVIFKITDDLTVILALLRSVCVKAARERLVKLTAAIND